MHKLSEKQIEELMALAKVAKKQNATLLQVFEEIASKYSLKAGSVRNVYYKRLKDGKGVDGLTAKQVKPFSKEEQKDMLKRVLIARRNTSSMRGAFLEVAQGDEKLAMRYQNKYCNMLKKERSAVMREILSQKRFFGYSYNPYLSKNVKSERLKLKKEIDELIKRITEKCAEENALLKKKLAVYEKLVGVEQISGGEKSARDFFSKNQSFSENGKAN